MLTNPPDVLIERPTPPLPKGFHSVQLVARHEWAPDLFTLRLEGDVPPLKAGQYVALALHIDGEWVERHYSVASQPGAELEFYVTTVAEGTLTPRLYGLPMGAELACSDRSFGGFVLAKVPDAKILWLVSTGTGLAPYISMLRDGGIWQRFDKVVIVHGVRFAADLGYRDELQEFGQQFGERFGYVAAVSREVVAGTVPGRITSAFASGALESDAGCRFEAETSHVMLCGNPAMLDEMKAMLAERGMIPHRKRRPGHISFEKYW